MLNISLAVGVLLPVLVGFTYLKDSLTIIFAKNLFSLQTLCDHY